MSTFPKKSNSNSKHSPSTVERGEESFFGVQAKLNIGKSNDKFEAEADATADKVVSNKKNNSKGFFTPPQPALVQKQTAKEDQEVQTKEEKEPLQKSATTDTNPTNTSALEGKLQSSKGGGSPLTNQTKEEMESGFGADFSDVKIHSDSNAIQMNKELGSQAFASGNDVYFNQGKYNPDSQSGKHLLAHELTHTLQQGGNKPNIQKEDPPNHLDSLNEMLDSFNVPEDEVILMCSQLEESERATVLADGSYKRRMADALNVAEMTSAVNNLGWTLDKKLEWVNAAATFGTTFMSYSEIKGMVIAADQPQRDALKTDTWRSFFVGVCDNTTMVEALDDLQFDLITKLTWLKAEMTITSMELSYSTIKPWITHANTTPAERDSLKTNADVGMSFFVDVCDNTTMVEALDDLQFDLITKLTWLKAEMTITSWELSYSTIKPWIIHTNTTQAERDSLKTNTDLGMSFFVDVCTNATMVEALDDLQFDLITKLTWLHAEMTITSWELHYPTIKPWIIHANTTQIERDSLKTEEWKAFFGSVCTNVTIIEALTDLQFDLKTKIEWTRTEAGLEEVKQIIELATKADRDLVWNDAAYLASLRSEVGDNYYLWVIIKLRMLFVGSIAHTSAVDADAAIQTHLSAYVGGGVAEGRQIEGFVAVVDTLNWNIAGENHYGASVWATKNVSGFVDSERRVWIEQNSGNPGTMVHEGTHKYSTRTLINLSQPLNEGVTEYFTRMVCNAAGINISTRTNYQDNWTTATKLVALVGEAVVAAAYFDGDTDTLESTFVSAGGTGWSTFLNETKSGNWTAADAYL
ncbi:DUF4157 domain-containing protein [Flavobacterium sp. ABG]|uniref:eCIS core domain-containing protein n=1 Tax=Flavobacterium sp. ABG TaxID=1423322 RepID=UPI0006998D87|nr:DUF4157 domain-containing protein [Flavobacterium sp. ABG]